MGHHHRTTVLQKHAVGIYTAILLSFVEYCACDDDNNYVLYGHTMKVSWTKDGKILET